MASVRLFVYGTLKRGGRFHDELRGASFLGEAETAPGYALVHVGEYLALTEALPREPGGEAAAEPEVVKGEAAAEPEVVKGEAAAEPEVVNGELFEVPEAILPALDEFEGDAYIRRQLAVRLVGTGDVGMALAYFRKAR